MVKGFIYFGSLPLPDSMTENKSSSLVKLGGQTLSRGGDGLSLSRGTCVGRANANGQLKLHKVLKAFKQLTFLEARIHCINDHCSDYLATVPD